jgi:hypothetical protein
MNIIDVLCRDRNAVARHFVVEGHVKHAFLPEKQSQQIHALQRTQSA